MSKKEREDAPGYSLLQSLIPHPPLQSFLYSITHYFTPPLNLSSLYNSFFFIPPKHTNSNSCKNMPLSTDSSAMNQEQQQQLLDKLKVFRIQGRDRRGHIILRILAKFFPARDVSVDGVNKYLEDKIFPELEKRSFSVLYVHTDVEKSQNFPGISALRSFHDAIPASVIKNLQAVYFLHPGLQSRLFLATFGRFMFTSGLYGKLRYVSRVDYLWDHVRRNEIDLPEFVYDHDEDLEYRPMMDYGLESDHPRVYGAPSVDYSPSTYSTRCIS